MCICHLNTGTYFQVILSLNNKIKTFETNIEITAPQMPNNGINRKFIRIHAIPPYTLVEK